MDNKSIYIVLASGKSPSKHTYVVGAFFNLGDAENVAVKESFERANKYELQVWEFEEGVYEPEKGKLVFKF